MADCRVTAGIGYNCGDVVTGGLRKKVYLGNISDLEESNPYTVDSNGYVTAFNFIGTSTGLVEFEAPKESHSAGQEITRTEGGNPSFVHTLVLRVFENTPADAETIEELAKADVFLVVENSDGTFKVFGLDLGLNLSATQNTGTTTSADTRWTLTLAGGQLGLAQYFFITSRAATVNLLQSYVL